ncbi:MAG: ABC transporter ATP-binding protein [Candidatus Berkelbacteria bacterium]|nr:ABC transporter ATP-binding protein [Candidatus Berkelbacteria bacterium]
MFHDLQLDVSKGEFVTIFGPNGSGKTTLLNIISGLEEPSSGEVLINGKKPKDADVGFVFQNYNESLFPWLTTIENIAFPLSVKGVSKEEQLRIAEHTLSRVGLIDSKDKYVYQLSGGQRQLVSICRAIAMNPDVLIMDEPFSALDYSTTRKMELHLLDIWQEQKITTLFVSHDIEEAIFLADRVAVLSPQPATIKKIFEVKLPRPRTLGMFTKPNFTELRNAVLESFEYDS